MRAILLACVCATGCELYFGPANQDAAPTATPDAPIVVEPDAATLVPPDPPMYCSLIPVYVQSGSGDERAPFATALIKDALAFYHVPIVATNTPPTNGNSVTIVLSQAGNGKVIPVETCSIGGAYVVGDDRSRSNGQIVADALHAVGVMAAIPPGENAGDCMAAVVVPGCTFGRAQTLASDFCGTSAAQPVDEAQTLANVLGCP